MVDPAKSDATVKRLNFEEDPNESIMKQYLNKPTDEEEDTLAALLAQGKLENTNKKDKDEIKQDTKTGTPKVSVADDGTCTDINESNLPIFKGKIL